MLSIANEVDSLIFRRIHAYFHQMVSEQSSFRICITCFVSFGIRENSFMMLEDYAFNFLHGCWNYVLIKTDIDVMMFKFEFKYVKLNFKAIASMEFSFDIKFYLPCSYDVYIFMKTVEKLFRVSLQKLKTRVFRRLASRKVTRKKCLWFTKTISQVSFTSKIVTRQ